MNLGDVLKSFLLNGSHLNFIMKLVFLLTFTLLFSRYDLHGQERSEDAPTFNITFRTLALEKGDYTGIFIQADPEEEPTPVYFNRYRRSGSVTYKGTSPIIFFRIEETSDPEIPFRKVPIARFKITEATPTEDLLLLTRPNPVQKPNQPELFISGMDDSRDAFPQNTVIFMNLTSLELIGLVNEERADFPKGPSIPFSLTTTFKTSVIFDDTKDFHFLLDNSFSFEDDSRVILVLQPPKRKGSLRIRCRYIVDTSSPEPTSTPEPLDED